MTNVAVVKMGQSSRGNAYFGHGKKQLLALAEQGDAGAHTEIQRRIANGSTQFADYVPPGPTQPHITTLDPPPPTPVPEVVPELCRFCLGNHPTEGCPTRGGDGAPPVAPRKPPTPPGAPGVAVVSPKKEKEPNPRSSARRPFFKYTKKQLEEAVAAGLPGALEEQQNREIWREKKDQKKRAPASMGGGSLRQLSGKQLRDLAAGGHEGAKSEINRRAANRIAQGKKPIGVR